MKKFCDDSMKIINFGKKKKISLTNKEYKSYLNQTNCHIYKKRFEDKYPNDKKYCRVRDHCHYTGKYIGVAHCICYLKDSIPK